eukprot:SAG11_NODE_4717_length_1794_cov_3.004130_1_plen_257_part_00
MADADQQQDPIAPASEAAAPAPAPEPELDPDQSEEDDESVVSPISLENGPAPPTNYKLILKAFEQNRLDILENEGIAYVEMRYKPPDTRILREFIFREWDEQGELREMVMERDQAIQYFERKLQTPMTAATKTFIQNFIEAAMQEAFIDVTPAEFMQNFELNDELMHALKNPPICIITQEPPVDPVLASDGNIYDRTALLQWLEMKCASPATNKPMLRGMIDIVELKQALQLTQPAADIPEFFFCAPAPAGKLSSY